jgi:hypothetical protein
MIASTEFHMTGSNSSISISSTNSFYQRRKNKKEEKKNAILPPD